MKLAHVFKPVPERRMLTDQRGFLLIAALVLMAILSLLGTTAYILSATDIKIGGNYKSSESVLQVAIAATEHAREMLRAENATDSAPFTDPTTLNAELAYHAGPNGTFEFNAAGSDDIPLATGTLGGISYVAYLSNDAVDMNNGTPIADSNNLVLIRSIATDSKGSQAIAEVTVSLPPPPAAPPPLSIPPPVALVLMPGNSATFLGGNSNAKELNGADQCGSTAPLPVVSPVASGSLPGIQSSIDGTKPKTYWTNLPNGTAVNASDHMGNIATTVTQAQIDNMKNNYSVDVTSASSLNNMVNSIREFVENYPSKGIIAPGGSDTSTVNLGDTRNLKLVVVDGDFTAKPNSSGAGLLVVKGQLTFDGKFNYTGLIMVVGKGIMVRSGSGNGTINGAVWVANTAGPDSIPGNGDDAMGASVLNTSGAGNSNFNFCSSAVNNAISTTAPPPTYSPLVVKSFRHVLGAPDVFAHQ